jgi:hypothetical protein
MQIAEGKPLNQFGFDGAARDADYARRIVHETHGFWKQLQERHQTEVEKA